MGTVENKSVFNVQLLLNLKVFKKNAKCAGETRDSSGAPRGQEEVNISALNFCQKKQNNPDTEEAQQPAVVPELSPHLPFIRIKTNK